MLRVVLDTNVLVSALISDGKPRELFRKGIENQFSIVTSDQLLKELIRVLRRPKFKTSPSEIRRIMFALLNTVEVVGVKTNLKVVKDDPKDDLVIETAFDGHANFVATGDRHLLELASFRGIKITTVENLLELL